MRTLALALALALALPAAGATAALSTRSTQLLASAFPFLIRVGPAPHVFSIVSASDAPQLVHLELRRASTAALVLEGAPQVVVAGGRIVKDHGRDVVLAPHATLRVDGAGHADIIVRAREAGASATSRWST